MHHTIFNTPIVKSFFRGISLALLKILGWKVSGRLPQKEKFVLIVAPHTSNWDLFYGIILAFALKLDAIYVAKKELFRGPFSLPMKWSGAIPVDRSSHTHFVEHMASQFENNKKFVLALAPEGTRHKKDCWKSGFYYIALKAHVPILLAFIDYERKTGGAGPLIYPTGDMEKDMEVIRNFYMTVKGRYPENASSVVIRAKS
ncbi:acyltransferase family protein [hydrocarbon metagenome]|uniref:Acyltransferase family protein n=1 Tax=hydrocarbon metagenome TaxID=938273 RepID=A0A0W8FSJ4_9ZZZZ